MTKKTKFTALNFEEYPDIFTFDGINCPALSYDNRYAKGYEGYSLIDRDLEHCLDCLGHLEKHQVSQPSVATWACTIAMIVTYGKCFVRASGRQAGLNRSHIPKANRAVHDELMKLRHKYVAHAGGEGEGSFNYVGINPDLEEKRIVAIATPCAFKTSGLGKDKRDEMHVIVTKLREHVSGKLEALRKQIVDSLHAENIEDLYKHFDPSIFEELPKPKFAPGHYTIHFNIEPNGIAYVKAVRSN